jgi:hypothetical protein
MRSRSARPTRLFLDYLDTALNQMNSRVFAVPASLGVEHRILNRYAYHSPNSVTDEVTLPVDCGGDRILRRPEGDKERVALRVDRDERLTQQAMVIGHQLAVAISAEILEQPRRALDVREQEGDGAA